MKFVIVFAALFAVALAAPQSPADKQATITSQNADIAPDNSQYSFGLVLKCCCEKKITKQSELE